MPTAKNVIIGNYSGHQLCVDVFTPEKKGNFPVAIFLPGFKGFKDWGFFPLMHEVFVHEGVALVTVNFSHNGVNAADPAEFTDLNGFAQNTITQELKEVKAVVEWVVMQAENYGWDPGAIALVGHSRGGAEAIIYACGDARINRVIAWAPVAELGLSFKDVDKAAWKKEGQTLILNARTGQKMPVNYGFWEDLNKHAKEFDVLHCSGIIEMPMMLVHGDSDESVPIGNSDKIYEQCLHAVMIPVAGGTHTFNTGHPWVAGTKFPFQLQEVLVNTIEFILD